MGKGREIMGWWEPGEWLRAAKEHAKAEGIRTYPVKPMLITFAMLGGLLAYKWSEADPAKRVSPLGAVMILVILCLVITGLVRLMGAINRTRTSLHEHGLLHGPLDSRRWIPYGTIQLFTIEEDEIGGGASVSSSGSRSNWRRNHVPSCRRPSMRSASSRC